mmetsp:Transcript_33705/g.79487  ORF Transcript_33705/g.79487 Transcript_33705/m.79487 type:complete len:266 (+) Transcript_33705:49-846(+)
MAHATSRRRFQFGRFGFGLRNVHERVLRAGIRQLRKTTRWLVPEERTKHCPRGKTRNQGVRAGLQRLRKGSLGNEPPATGTNAKLHTRRIRQGPHATGGPADPRDLLGTKRALCVARVLGRGQHVREPLEGTHVPAGHWPEGRSPSPLDARLRNHRAIRQGRPGIVDQPATGAHLGLRDSNLRRGSHTGATRRPAPTRVLGDYQRGATQRRRTLDPRGHWPRRQGPQPGVRSRGDDTVRERLGDPRAALPAPREGGPVRESLCTF